MSALPFLALGALPALVLARRHWLMHQHGTPPPPEPFDGVVYRVGAATVAERRSTAPRHTVLCMHGFLEDHRYFLRHYAADDVQLLLVTSAGYHLPVKAPVERPADWARVPAAPEGSIAYDAEVLLQALEHLVHTPSVRVHGHSRGGAVILEAASRRPDLFENVEVVLEAPVLPQGRQYRAMSRAQLWLLPFFIGAWRKEPISRRNLPTWGPLDDARKKELISAYPSNVRTVATMVHNIEDLDRWMREKDASLFRHVKRGVVLVPGKDKVLDAKAMLAAAQACGGHLDVVQLEGCSHFPLFDRPDAVPPLGGVASATG